MRCDICFDEEKGCKKHCKGIDCKNHLTCHRVYKPTVRITTKCTQSCSHCCFSCSPKKDTFMSIDMAKDINTFFTNNKVSNVNLMGGEFYCHPEWESVLDIIGNGLQRARIVSNGDWAGNAEVSGHVINFLKAHPNFHISVSNDKFHTNKYVEAAERLLNNAGVLYNISNGKNSTTNESIVPVGKASLGMHGIYSMFGCYCHNPEHKYSFLIDEEGKIYKCSFGVWDFATIDEHKDGSFAERFKFFNSKFYGVWINNCRRCVEAYERIIRN